VVPEDEAEDAPLAAGIVPVMPEEARRWVSRRRSAPPPIPPVEPPGNWAVSVSV
jgi:hypothetical protein